jgi:hypothetical protein
MPICKKCNKIFPNKIIINGKQRKLNNRKYCFDCSSFGKYNSKTILKELEGNSLICMDCGKTYFLNRSFGHRRNKCGSCRTYEQRQKRKKMSVDYLEGKCVKCGYNKCLAALSFHHRDENEKEFGLSGNLALSWIKVKKELDKCKLLCANCHAELHDEIDKLKRQKFGLCVNQKI